MTKNIDDKMNDKYIAANLKIKPGKKWKKSQNVYSMQKKLLF